MKRKNFKEVSYVTGFRDLSIDTKDTEVIMSVKPSKKAWANGEVKEAEKAVKEAEKNEDKALAAKETADNTYLIAKMEFFKAFSDKRGCEVRLINSKNSLTNNTK
jgi:hypothetical protein